MDWKDQIDPLLKVHLEKEIMESIKNKNAYQSSENPGIAQLWIAISNLSKKIFDLDLKFDYLDKTLKEIRENTKKSGISKKTFRKIKKRNQKSYK